MVHLPVVSFMLYLLVFIRVPWSNSQSISMASGVHSGSMERAFLCRIERRVQTSLAKTVHLPILPILLFSTWGEGLGGKVKPWIVLHFYNMTLSIAFQFYTHGYVLCYQL